MTTRRAVTYGGLFCLLAAWLASAASTTLQYRRQAATPEISTAVTTSPETLAADVQAQAARLRQRLASAPVPLSPHRNPFLFESRPLPPPRHVARRSDPAVASEPLPPAEPVLALIGVAEDQGPKGSFRTAILTDDSDAVFMVTVGQTVLGRYTVEAIGADVVELKDMGTNARRRLALQ